MSVTLIKAYGGFIAGSVVTFPDSTETALIAQGLATSTGPSSVDQGRSLLISQGGNLNIIPVTGQGAITSPGGPAIIPVIPLTAFASAGTSGVHVAGTMYLAEVYVPEPVTIKGVAALNGATVGTDNILAALYNSAGALVANSAVAGALSANANTFQKLDFTASVNLMPGRYFIGVQCNGTTATTRRLKAADSPNVLTTSGTGTFGTIPASITVPTAFADVSGVISYIYVV